MPTRKDKVLSVRFTAAEYAAVARLAEDLDVSAGEAVRRAVRHCVRALDEEDRARATAVAKPRRR